MWQKVCSSLPLQELVLEESEPSWRFHYFHKLETKMDNRNMLPHAVLIVWGGGEGIYVQEWMVMKIVCVV